MTLSVDDLLLRPDAPKRWNAAADWMAAAAVVALWMLARPYRGVRHDALLYLGAALDRLSPERFGSDLYLHHVAQDRWSVFSPLMALLVGRFGIAGPEMLALVGCHVLFVFACWKLTEGWFERPLRWAAMMAVAVLPHTYGGLGEFSFAEPFLTARSVAEPLALLALANLLRGRLAVGMLLAALAMVFHPLMTLPVLVVGWLVLVQRRGAWAWLGLLPVVLVAAGRFGIAPLDALWHTYDPAWLAAFQEADAQAFIANQTRLDWSPVAFDALVLLLVLRSSRVPPDLKQLACAVLVAAFVLTIAWWLGVDVFRNVLLTQVQLWRINWVLHLVAVLALPWVLTEHWQRGWVGRWCAAALGVAGIAVLSNWPTGWLCLLWAIVALAAALGKARISDATAKAAVAASFLAMAGITAKVAATTLSAVLAAPDRFGGASLLLVVLGLPFVGAVAIVGLLWLLLAPRRWRVAGWAAVAVGIVFGAQMWDQRSTWQRRLEAGGPDGSPALDAALPAQARVYWVTDLATPWLLARHGNFFNYEQGAGLLFDRTTALEFARRKALLSGLDLQHGLCQTVRMLTGLALSADECQPTVEVLVDLCKNAPELDDLVFPMPLSMPAVAEWHDAASAGPSRRSLYLYSCAALR